MSSKARPVSSGATASTQGTGNSATNNSAFENYPIFYPSANHMGSVRRFHVAKFHPQVNGSSTPSSSSSTSSAPSTSSASNPNQAWSIFSPKTSLVRPTHLTKSLLDIRKEQLERKKKKAPKLNAKGEPMTAAEVAATAAAEAEEDATASDPLAKLWRIEDPRSKRVFVGSRDIEEGLVGNIGDATNLDKSLTLSQKQLHTLSGPNSSIVSAHILLVRQGQSFYMLPYTDYYTFREEVAPVIPSNLLATVEKAAAAAVKDPNAHPSKTVVNPNDLDSLEQAMRVQSEHADRRFSEFMKNKGEDIQDALIGNASKEDAIIDSLFVKDQKLAKRTANALKSFDVAEEVWEDSNTPTLAQRRAEAQKKRARQMKLYGADFNRSWDNDDVDNNPLFVDDQVDLDNGESDDDEEERVKTKSAKLMKELLEKEEQGLLNKKESKEAEEKKKKEAEEEEEVEEVVNNNSDVGESDDGEDIDESDLKDIEDSDDDDDVEDDDSDDDDDDAVVVESKKRSAPADISSESNAAKKAKVETASAPASAPSTSTTNSSSSSSSSSNANSSLPSSASLISADPVLAADPNFAAICCASLLILHRSGPLLVKEFGVKISEVCKQRGLKLSTELLTKAVRVCCTQQNLPQKKVVVKGSKKELLDALLREEAAAAATS